MDVNGLLSKYAQHKFVPNGADRFGVYMQIDHYRIHVRHDDAPLVKGMVLRDAWPLVDKIEMA